MSRVMGKDGCLQCFVSRKSTSVCGGFARDLYTEAEDLLRVMMLASSLARGYIQFEVGLVKYDSTLSWWEGTGENRN